MGAGRKMGDWAFKGVTAALGIATIYLGVTFSVNVYRGLAWHNSQTGKVLCKDCEFCVFGVDDFDFVPLEARFDLISHGGADALGMLFLCRLGQTFVQGLRLCSTRITQPGPAWSCFTRHARVAAQPPIEDKLLKRLTDFGHLDAYAMLHTCWTPHACTVYLQLHSIADSFWLRSSCNVIQLISETQQRRGRRWKTIVGNVLKRPVCRLCTIIIIIRYVVCALLLHFILRIVR
ncbi:hypothetical protein Dimus_004817 [Dionaea muscipula]